METGTGTEDLLALVSQVIESSSPEARRSLEAAERARFERSPTTRNRLRVALVRAYSAALPAELMKTRGDLYALASGDYEVSEQQRYLALMALVMVDQRLQMGTQITDLQQQIDSLTEIEASLNSNDAERVVEPSS